MEDEQDINQMKRDNSIRLYNAIQLLKAKRLKIKDIRLQVAAILPSTYTLNNDQAFSRYLGAHRKEGYLNAVHLEVYKYIFEIVDPLVWKHCEKKLKGDKHYLGDGETVPEELPHSESSRLSALNGFWVGFSWNKKRSEKHQKVILNVIKLTIKQIDMVLCETEKSPNEIKGKIDLITDAKISIYLSKERIRITVFGSIGDIDNAELRILPYIKCAYVNSGINKITAGLLWLERADENFNNCKVGGIEVSNPDTTNWLPILDFLKNSQSVID